MERKTYVTGFPRIGERRELKKALEEFWSNKLSEGELQKAASTLRKKHWLIQKEKGIDFISCNDFSFYDNMLDTAVMLNAIPERFQSIYSDTKRYFAMARGYNNAVAMEMTKWFNTNYHYIVPELSDNLRFKLNASKIIKEYNEAKDSGISPKINIISPVTFLGLSKTDSGKSPYKYFNRVLDIYKELIETVSSLNDDVYVQIDDPIFVRNPTDDQLDMLKTTYTELSSIKNNVHLIFAAYFEHAKEAVKTLCNVPIYGIALDFVYGRNNLEVLEYIGDKKLIAGVVDGKNVWVNNFDKTLNLLNSISEKINKDNIIISTSCSLLHVPYTSKNELDSNIKKFMSFAYEKLDEIVSISQLFHFNKGSDILQNNRLIAEQKEQLVINLDDSEFRQSMKDIKKTERDGSFKERRVIQKRVLNLPLLPATTIGSFPQTDRLRKIRRDYKKGIIPKDEYENGIRKYIDECIAFQEEIDFDVLVHGEPERNDMVEYFGEMLDGFHFTKNGWVQSYGSRCVKPPIIYADIKRPFPMTVKWISYAQSKTKKPVKGMLTGPVTMVNWSFIRDDISRFEVSKQIAIVLRDEINDLQNAGIKVIQVDEPAFKEGYPLRKENIKEYEKWAVDNFKLAVSVAKKETQIHTHMCYSEFNDIIKTIEAMDADVITLETARSGNELLKVFRDTGYKNEVGPGVYDIHSPRVPSIKEFEKQILLRIEVLPVEQLWINPDCGLKTRKWEDVKPALSNMMSAVKNIRNIYNK